MNRHTDLFTTVLSRKGEDAVADYRIGMTLADCAAKYGVSIGTIQRAVIMAGSPTRSPGRKLLSATTISQIVADYTAGQTLADLSYTYGRSTMSIRAYLLKEGVVIRPKGRRLKSNLPPSPSIRVLAMPEPLGADNPDMMKKGNHLK